MTKKKQILLLLRSMSDCIDHIYYELESLHLEVVKLREDRIRNSDEDMADPTGNSVRHVKITEEEE